MRRYDWGLEAARDVPRVSVRACADCLLVEFGDSTIDLELRFWINDPVNGITECAQRGDAEHVGSLSGRHGIELPHPQRDLTLRNPEALAGRLADVRPAAKTQTLSRRADQRN